MIKKAVAAAFVSAGLLGTLGSAAWAQPPAAACDGLMNAHQTVPEDNTTAHASIPHPHCH